MKKLFETRTIEQAIETLIDYRGKTPPKTTSGVWLITAKVIKEGFIQNENKEFIAADFYDEWMRRGLPKQWDVLVTTEAPLGEVAQIRTPEKVALAQRVILLRSNPDVVNQGYLYQAMKSPFVQGELKARSSGTTVLGIKQSELWKVKIPWYPLPTQRKIAGVLSAYDDLIENNTRRIAILEEMAQAIYREWFVNFRFPGHDNVKLVESPLGKIPEGWKVATLKEACESVIDGDWIETKDQGGEDYRLLQVSNIGKGCFVETGNYRYVTQATFDRLRCQEVKSGQVLISRMPKPIGRAWLVTEMPWRMITAVDVAIATAHPEKSTAHFLVSYLNSPEHIDNAEKHATGTTRPRVSRSALSGLRFVLPSFPIQQLFTNAVADGYSLVSALRKKNDVLRQTRDLLLPKLISGQLDVEELEIETGEPLVEVQA